MTVNNTNLRVLKTRHEVLEDTLFSSTARISRDVCETCGDKAYSVRLPNGDYITSGLATRSEALLVVVDLLDTKIRDLIEEREKRRLSYMQIEDLKSVEEFNERFIDWKSWNR